MMKMKTIEKSLINILSLSLIVLCLASEHSGQMKTPESKTKQETSSVSQVDLSNWQTILLKEKGMKFKLPPGWQHEGEDLTDKNGYFTLEEMGWVSPNKELIRISITTAPNGFRSLRRTVISKEEAIEEEFNSVMESTKGDSTFSDVKKLEVSGVGGVFRRLQVDFKDKDIGKRNGMVWTGYRIYQGKSQEVDFNLSADPKGEELLRTIFNTIEIEHDKDKPRKP